METKSRKYFRFKPDEGEAAFIDLNFNGDFKPQVAALIFEEAQGGCGVVVLNPLDLHMDDLVHIKVGKLNPTEARVAWIEKINSQLSKIGFEFIGNLI